MNARLTATAVALSLAMAGPAPAETAQDRLLALLTSFDKDYGFPGATGTVALVDGRVVTAATGVADDSTDPVPAPEAALADLAIGRSDGTGQP